MAPGSGGIPSSSTRTTSRNTSGIPNPAPTYTEIQANKPKSLDAHTMFLVDKGYLINTTQEDTPSIDTLSHSVLLLASYAKGQILLEGAMAIAALMRAHTSNQAAEEVAKLIMKKIGPCIDRVDLMEQKMERAAEKLSATYEEARDEMQRTAEAITEATETLTNAPINTNTEGPKSYVAAAQMHLPPTHPETLARNTNRKRQILIDKNPGSEFNVQNLTEKELVVKANLAIDNMNPELQITGVQFLGAKKLLNGGVVYEMSCDEMAEWIKMPEVRKEFESCFGGVASIKDRNSPIFVEYIPVAFNPENDGELRMIEESVGLETGEIKQVKWVEAIERREKGQRTAHAIFNMSSVEGANMILRHGIHIQGKKVFGRKMKKEPKRCLKCQKINSRHFAKDCPENDDLCGTCGLKHRTDKCAEKDQEKFHCANCKVYGHASWDRMCPIILKAANQLESSDREASYKYFPTEEEWTWEQNNKPTPMLPPGGFDPIDLARIIGPENQWKKTQHKKQPPPTYRRQQGQNPNNIPLGNNDDGWAGRDPQATQRTNQMQLNQWYHQGESRSNSPPIDGNNPTNPQ